MTWIIRIRNVKAIFANVKWLIAKDRIMEMKVIKMGK